MQPSLNHRCIICQCGLSDHTEVNCPQRCKIPECKGYHLTEKHYCIICEEMSTNHVEANCPKICKIPDCFGYHRTEKHFCIICNKKPTDHIEANCPHRCTLCRGYHKTDKHHNSSSNSYSFPKQHDIGLSALGRELHSP